MFKLKLWSELKAAATDAGFSVVLAREHSEVIDGTGGNLPTHDKFK